MYIYSRPFALNCFGTPLFSQTLTFMLSFFMKFQCFIRIIADRSYTVAQYPFILLLTEP